MERGEVGAWNALRGYDYGITTLLKHGIEARASFVDLFRGPKYVWSPLVGNEMVGLLKQIALQLHGLRLDNFEVLLRSSDCGNHVLLRFSCGDLLPFMWTQRGTADEWLESRLC